MAEKHIRYVCLSMFVIFVLFSKVEATDIGMFFSNVKDCKVQRNNICVSCSKGAMIQSGDIIEIQAGIEAIDAFWMDRESTRFKNVGKNQYTVTLERRTDKSPKDSMFKMFTDFNRKVFQSRENLVTRSSDSLKSFQTPPSGSTLLSGEHTMFSWCEKGMRLNIFDAGNKLIYSCNVANINSTILQPDMAGLKPGEVYSWRIDNGKEGSYTIKVLNKTLSTEVTEELKTIDTVKPDEKIQKKVSYLAFLNDFFPEKYDLRWLIWQVAFAEGFNRLTAEEKKYILFLIGKNPPELCN